MPKEKSPGQKKQQDRLDAASQANAYYEAKAKAEDLPPVSVKSGAETGKYYGGVGERLDDFETVQASRPEGGQTLQEAALGHLRNLDAAQRRQGPGDAFPWEQYEALWDFQREFPEEFAEVHRRWVDPLEGGIRRRDAAARFDQDVKERIKKRNLSPDWRPEHFRGYDPAARFQEEQLAEANRRMREKMMSKVEK